MMSIIEFFDSLYDNTTNDSEWEVVYEYEESIYNMESSEEFEDWARKNNIDLAIIDKRSECTILQHWSWIWEELSEREI